MYKPSIVTLFVLLFSIYYYIYNYNNSLKPEEKNNNRYLLYDINPYEGFNLRRDVYMRIAILGYHLQRSEDENLRNFKIVLPPWSRLVHWSYQEKPEQIPWSYYFDLESLKKFAPVIEMYELFEEVAKDNKHRLDIDEVYILQHFADMFETGNFEERIAIEPCQKEYHLSYFHYNNITANNIRCLSYHKSANGLAEVLKNTTAKTILIHHAEVALHEYFGGKLYWQARRSMRFNKELRLIANNFRALHLNSHNSSDNTILPEDWRDEKPKRSAKGGPYIAIHMRRRDFLQSHSKHASSLHLIAQHVEKYLKKYELERLFVATDASDVEYEELISYLSPKYKIFRYVPKIEVREKYKDGAAAIIDQIICSHGRYFIGTHESTFSFRIHEEREILGFPTATTFNCFCAESEDCTQPTVWKIIY